MYLPLKNGISLTKISLFQNLKVASCTGLLSDALLNDKNLEKATELLSRNNYPRDIGVI